MHRSQNPLIETNSTDDIREEQEPVQESVDEQKDDAIQDQIPKINSLDYHFRERNQSGSYILDSENLERYDVQSDSVNEGAYGLIRYAIPQNDGTVRQRLIVKKPLQNKLGLKEYNLAENEISFIHRVYPEIYAKLFKASDINDDSFDYRIVEEDLGQNIWDVLNEIRDSRKSRNLTALEVYLKVAQEIQRVHETCGIVHLDLNRGNITLKNEVVYLIDASFHVSIGETIQQSVKNSYAPHEMQQGVDKIPPASPSMDVYMFSRLMQDGKNYLGFSYSRFLCDAINAAHSHNPDDRIPMRYLIDEIQKELDIRTFLENTNCEEWLINLLINSETAHNYIYIDCIPGVVTHTSESLKDYHLTGYIAPDLQDVLNRSSDCYKDYMSNDGGYTFFSHTKNGTNKVLALVAQSNDCITFEGKISKLHEYFVNEITNENGKSFGGRINAHNHSYISFFLNELKYRPDLISAINICCDMNNDALYLDVATDYTLEVSTSGRKRALVFFKNATFQNIHNDPPEHSDLQITHS